jgi:hypothetical protein
VYTGSYFWRDTIKALDVRPIPLWIAHYTTKYCPLVPEPWTGWTFHQWGVTEVGSVPGVDAKIDRDVFNGNRAELDRFIALSHLDGHLDDAPRPPFEAPPALAPVTAVDETSPDGPEAGCTLVAAAPKSASYAWLLGLGIAVLARMRRKSRRFTAATPAAESPRRAPARRARRRPGPDTC